MTKKKKVSCGISPRARESRIRNFDILRTRGAIAALTYLVGKYGNLAGGLPLQSALSLLKSFDERQFPRKEKEDTE